MNSLDKLKTILQVIKDHRITAYEISQATGLSSVGIQKIINGDTKKPNELTLNTILDYLHNNIVATNYKSDDLRLPQIKEPDLANINNPLELITCYKKQIVLFEKNMHLYEENAGLYRENAGLLREKVHALSAQLGL